MFCGVYKVYLQIPEYPYSGTIGQVTLYAKRYDKSRTALRPVTATETGAEKPVEEEEMRKKKEEMRKKKGEMRSQKKKMRSQKEVSKKEVRARKQREIDGSEL